MTGWKSTMLSSAQLKGGGGGGTEDQIRESDGAITNKSDKEIHSDQNKQMLTVSTVFELDA